VALSLESWLVTDVPARSLWLVEDGVPRRIELTEADITPGGLALGDGVLFVADLSGRVWSFVLGGRD
jgi:hypothetical protein